MDERKYEGTAYIGVVGNENEIGECRDTIEQIQRRDGDALPYFIRATKGYEARQMHFNNFIESDHAFMLLLDHDMKFPPNTLEQLRIHGLPFVSGLYMRRRYAPMLPVWFERGEAGRMPMVPFTAVPAPKTLYPIGASGWGCILIHRDVVTATRELLRGEPDVIEDDMDVYPYDLGRIMGAIRELSNGIGSMTMRQAREQIGILKEEIRPLRAVKDSVGSDIRYPFYARLAGFDLWGDSGVLCEHMLNYPLNPGDYAGQSAATVRDITIGIRTENQKEVERLQKATAEL